MLLIAMVYKLETLKLALCVVWEDKENEVNSFELGAIMYSAYFWMVKVRDRLLESDQQRCVSHIGVVTSHETGPAK